MKQPIVSRCDCCGQIVDITQYEFCPICQYPVDPTREQHFLQTSLHDLQRVARYGGASLKVLDLVRRYEGRLQFLQAHFPAQTAPAAPTAAVTCSPSPLSRLSEIPAAPPSVVPATFPSLVGPSPVTEPGTPERVSTPSITPVVHKPEPAAMPVQPAASMRGFSLSGDAMVNVLAAVGGFLVLAGVLSTVFVTSNLWLSFLVVLGIHAVFGAASLLTRRSTLLRAVSPLYTIIFALLVPLLAFSAYRLVAHNLVPLSVPYLLTLAALYAAVIYSVLAVVQRFMPFAYLGSGALLVGDLALAQALDLAYWWWPTLALLLALVTLIALPRASGRDLFAEQRAILRTPLLVLMYTIAGATVLLIPALLAISLALDTLSQAHSTLMEAHLAVFVLTALLTLWCALWLRFTRRWRWTPLLAYLGLGVFLLLGYTMNLDLPGYILLETGVALFYHALVRILHGRFTTPGFPGCTLDGLALGLAGLVLLQTSAWLPFQLLERAFAQQPGAAENIRGFLSFSFTSDASHPAELFALAVCLLVTLDMALARTNFRKIPARADAGWCWLLLLGGLQLSSLYGLTVLLWWVYPLWPFLLLSLALLACAVLVRRFVGPAWAAPLDLLALGEIIFTLLLSLNQASIVVSAFLLGFAALLYAVSLYQRRPPLALVPALLLLLALVSLWTHLIVVLALSLSLPLLTAGLRRAGLFTNLNRWSRLLFTWTLLVPALVYGLVLAGYGMSAGHSVFIDWLSRHLYPTPGIALWLSVHVPVSYEMVALGLAWYGAALLALARATLSWLLPATLFWLLALLQPANDFWVLSLLTPALAVLGLGIEERTDTGWALPFYLVALCGGGLVVWHGFADGHLLALSWFLPGYALLAYGISVVSNRRHVGVWLVASILVPVCATLAVYVAAALLGDLYRPPLVALAGVVLGITAGRVALWFKQPPVSYTLPFYVSALAAAVLTGIYGMLGDLSRPFYGALPDALFLYALLAWAVVWIEQRARWTWLIALFACWGVLAAWRLSAWYVLGSGLGLALAGLLNEPSIRRGFHLARSISPASASAGSPWPWYSATLVAALLLGSWSTGTPVVQGMLIFTLLAVVVMLVRRMPELLVVPAGLAAWTIALWLSASGPISLIVAYTLLCVLIYGAQFAWRVWPGRVFVVPASVLHHTLSLGGLCVVLIFAPGEGALSPGAGLLAQAGILALVVLSALIFFYGLLRPGNAARALPASLDATTRTARLVPARELSHWCQYTVGLLLSVAVSWELLAFGQTRFDVLTLVPASYLIIIAPFLLRDQALSARHNIGQYVALLGSALLFLPALWFSFQGADLLPTLILLVEALVLVLLGLLLRMRIFILSSAALIIVGTLRLLFLAMPPSVPILLLVFGSLLMALATALILLRHRLQAAWKRWE